MGNEIDSFLSPFLEPNVGTKRQHSNLKDYRWFWSDKPGTWDNISPDEKWNIFPLELADKIEEAYLNRRPYELDNRLICFQYRDQGTDGDLNKESRHIQVSSQNEWNQTLILKEVPSHVCVIRKKIVNNFSPAQLNDNTQDYRVSLFKRLRVVFYEEIFGKFFDFDNSYNTLEDIMKKFCSHYLIVSEKFYNFLMDGYRKHLSHFFEEFKTFNFKTLKRLLVNDFKERTAYIKYFLKDIDENNFHETMIKMFLEEGFLYQDLLNFTANSSKENRDLTTYYLCLMFSLEQLRAKHSEMAYSTFYYSRKKFNKDCFYLNPNICITSKNKFNNYHFKTSTNNPSEGEGPLRLIEIKVKTPPCNNSICLNHPIIDISQLSLYNDEIVLLPNNSVLFCEEVTDTKVTFRYVEDFLSSAVQFMSEDDESRFCIYETFETRISKKVLYAKLLRDKVNYISNFRNARSIEVYYYDLRDKGLKTLSSFLSYVPRLISLNLIGNTFSAEVIKTLSNSLQSVPCLKYLNLGFNSLGDPEIKELKFDNLKELEILILKENKITSAGMSDLCNELKKAKNLRMIDLYDSPIGDVGFSLFCGIAEEIPMMERIMFSSCKITDVGMKSFFGKLIQGQFSRISHMNFKNNLLTNDIVDELCRVIPERLKYLSFVTFTQNLIIKGNCERILDSLIKVNPLWKYDNQTSEMKIMTDYELYKQNSLIPFTITVAMQNNKNAIIPKMIKKYKHYLKFNSSNVSSLASKASSYADVKKLDFEECHLKDEGFVNLLNIVNKFPEIERLWLRFNEITPVSMEVFAQKAENLKNLTHIDFSSNRLGDKGMKWLSEGIVKCPKIESIILCWNKITDQGLKTLISRFASLTSIRTLDFFGNIITDSGFAAFVKGGEVLRNLRCINFGKNQIGNAGLEALVEEIGNFHMLKDVNLSGNLISGEVYYSINEKIQLFLNLHHLDISGNLISKEMKNKLINLGMPSYFNID